MNDATIVKSGGSWGGSWYASECWLAGSGQSITFTAVGEWTLSSYGQHRSAVTIDGAAAGYVEGGGSVLHVSGPYAAGSVAIATSDGGSTVHNGGGGGSFCGRSVTVAAAATPSPTPAPSGGSLTCDPSCVLELADEDRDRLDGILYAGIGSVFALSALVIVAGFRRG